MFKMIRLASLAALVFAGCGGGVSTSVDPSIATEQEYSDVANAVGTSAASSNGDSGAMTDAILLSTGTTPAGLTVDASGHATGSLGSLSFDLTVTCEDAAGNAQAVCAAGTTDSAAVSVEWDGTLTLGSFSTSAQHDSAWTLTGLTTPTATLDGSGTFDYDLSLASASYTLHTAASYEGVAIDTASHQAVDGSIHYALSVTHTVNGVTRAFNMDAELTFNADHTGTLVLNGSHTYTVDLSTGVVVAVGN
jgi:hypothetical protein